MSRQFYRQIYEEETRYLGAYFACLVFLKQTKPQTNQKSNNKKAQNSLKSSIMNIQQLPK